MKILLYILLLISFLFQNHLFSQSGAYKFQQLGPEQGLPVEDIICFHQDRLGFLWFATTEGLLRFDGHRYRMFHFDGIPIYLFEDSQGKIWLSAGTGVGIKRSIQVFDFLTEKFIKIDVKPVVNHGFFNQDHFKAQNYFLEDIDKPI